MIIVMKAGATPHQIEHVFEKVRELGFRVHPIYGELRTVIACVGDERGKFRLQALDSLEGVENVVPILKPYKLASSEWHGSRTTITIPAPENGIPPVVIGGETIVVMAGPLLRREPRTNPSIGRAGKKSRSKSIARRCF